MLSIYYSIISYTGNLAFLADFWNKVEDPKVQMTSKGINERMLEDLERGSIALGRKGVPNAPRFDLDALTPSSSWIRSVQLFPHIDRTLPNSPERDSFSEVLNQWESKSPRYVHH